VPFFEYLIKWQQLLQYFYTEQLAPVHGMVTVPDVPGLGAEIDPAKIAEERYLNFDGGPIMSGSSSRR